jgi:membrane protease YdiL (CAAX protease family)
MTPPTGDVPAEVADASHDTPHRGALAGVLGTLTLSNVMANRLLPSWAYVPWNCTVAAAVTGLAVGIDGCSTEELGMSRAAIRRGLRLGAGMSAALLGIYAVGYALPATRDLFLDDRADLDGLALASKVLVQVPLGTVLLEEVAFRGVLPALFRRHLPAGRRLGLRADAASAVLFGVWHVLPAWHINSANPVFRDSLDGGAGRTVAVLGAVGSTAAVGMLFSWMRNRSGSIVAPMMLHTTSNSVAYLLAWAAQS